MKRPALLTIVLISTSLSCFSQTVDSARLIQHFSGSASVTNNGISLVPSFSLGRPAAIFLLSLGGQRFSVDPDIRFGLDGKPWTFLFWGRYKLKNEGRFRLGTGAHLGLNYRKATLLFNGEAAEGLVVRRYLAAELVPTYFMARNISVGSYYLYSHGLDAGTVSNTHFITLNVNFSRLPLTEQFYLRVNPQVYYLYQDGRDGRYLTGSIVLSKVRFPLSVSWLFNKTIRSNILGSKDFLSSFSLVYSFNRNYAPKQLAL